MRVQLTSLLVAFFLNFNLVLQAQIVNPIDEAQFYMRKGNHQEALLKLNIYLEEFPSDAEVYLKRALIHEILGQFVEKERDLEMARLLNPYIHLHVNQETRSKLYEKKNYDYAFDSESTSFLKSPVNARYYENYLEEIKEFHSQDILIDEAIFFLSQNDIESTENVLNEIKESEYISGILYDLKGVVMLRKNQLNTAIELFDKAIELMPLFPLAYHNRAIAYKLNGEYGKAEKDLMKAIELNENISVFYFTMAKLSERQENTTEAIRNYKMAIEKNPDYLEARANYSLLQKTLGNYDESIVELMEIIELNQNDNENHFLKGGIYLTYGEYNKAILEFDKYLIDDKNDSAAIFNRGLAKILNGDSYAGCRDLNSSLEIEFDYDREEILNSFCQDF